MVEGRTAPLLGKTALVTGASRGIGAGIAERLARDGAEVVINYVNSRDAAEEVATRIRESGGSAHVVQGDICDVPSLGGFFARVADAVDGLDILVNNAGMGGGFLSLDEHTPETYDRVMDINVRATFFVTQHAVRMMRDAGRIIMISSMASRIRQPGLSVYAASKAALGGLTRIFAIELAARGITVNAVESGIVDTDIIRAMPAERRDALVAMIPMGRIGEVRDIADVAAFLASDDSRWISGAEIPTSGGRYT